MNISEYKLVLEIADDYPIMLSIITCTIDNKFKSWGSLRRELKTACKRHSTTLNNYPNLKAVEDNCVSGFFGNWIHMRRDIIQFILDIAYSHGPTAPIGGM